MFWRSRDLPLPSIGKSDTLKCSRKKTDTIGDTDKSTIDSQMQSLKKGLKEYMTEKNDDEREREFISIKTSTSFTSDINIINTVFEKRAFVTFNESYCKEINGCDYLTIPEGITRIPFQPLPDILMRTIPSPKKLMNYYQRKAARSEPKSPSPASSAIRNSFASERQQRQIAHATKAHPQTLLATLFGGAAGTISPSPRKRSLRMGNSPRNKPGISWASESATSPTTPTSFRPKILNFYQSNLAPFVQTPTKSSGTGDPKKSWQSAVNEIRSPSVSKQIDVTTLQYLHSPKTPFSSPTRQHNSHDKNLNSESEISYKTSLKLLDSPSQNFHCSMSTSGDSSCTVEETVPNKIIDHGIWFGQE